MTDLLQLAERCEQAGGPDRVLDNSIANAIRRPLLQGEPFYTASLDAALTLVPEGCGWIVGLDIEQKLFASVAFDHQVHAATPALALCAAALRERAAL